MIVLQLVLSVGYLVIKVFLSIIDGVLFAERKCRKSRQVQKGSERMDWVYERLDKLVESGEMTEEEARQEYREYIEAQTEEYMNECLYNEQF